MKRETIKKANELQGVLNTLQNHKKEIIERNTLDRPNRAIMFHNGYHSSVTLLDSFVHFDEVIDLYMYRVDKRINELEKELDELTY